MPKLQKDIGWAQQTRDWFGFTNGRQDQSQALLVRGKQFINFFHVATGYEVFFKAFIKTFSDTYQSKWNPEAGYGRMDSIQIFDRTSRAITLGFSVPAASVEESVQNFKKLSILTQMLYPTFDPSKDSFGVKAQTIKAAPLWRVKFMNWVQDASTAQTVSRVFRSDVTQSGQGLLAACNGFTFSPNMEVGVFQKGTSIYPKEFNLQMTLNIIHEHPLGFSHAVAQTSKVEGEKMYEGTKKGFGPQQARFPYGEMIAFEERAPVANKSRPLPDNQRAAAESELFDNGGLSSPASSAPRRGGRAGGGAW